MLGKVSVFSNNSIKIIACLAMLIDHLGLMIFPSQPIFRIIGRIAMPLFGFCIAQGCKFTKNKLKYFLLVFLLGVACQAVYFIVNPSDIYFGILITFSLSILLIYSLQFVKKSFFEKGIKIYIKILSLVIFIGLLFGAKAFCNSFRVDYGFKGVMLPLICSLFDFRRINASENVKRIDCLFTQFLSFVLAMVYYRFNNQSMHVDYSLISILIILLYNGKRGKLNLKYLFYVFYPLHLVIIEAITYLL